MIVAVVTERELSKPCCSKVMDQELQLNGIMVMKAGSSRQLFQLNLPESCLEKW